MVGIATAGGSVMRAAGADDDAWGLCNNQLEKNV
jgi:hypothetical protein